MKNLMSYLIEGEQKKDKNSGFFVAVEIVIPNNDNINGDKKEKHSKKVLSYDTYVNMKNTGRTTNGDKILSITTIGSPVASKEKAQEYISHKNK